MTYARLMQNGSIFYAAYIDGSYYKIDGDLFAEHKVTDKKIEGDFKILAPVSPSKIIALGVNYRNHAAEMGEEVKSDPLIFMKPPTAVIAPYENIEIANPENRTDYEAELAVIIKSKCSRISADEAENYILGYTCANDVTDRVLQKKDGQWVRAKGFDTYCPLGPHIVTGISPMGLRVQSILNGEVRQDSTTDKMINNVFDTVAFISNIMTLLPGDVIMTGTPEGIGPLSAGDEIEIRISGVGSLVNKVVNRE
ncbi:MAG: fumarylacetoacetate hydrolase family protein [Clostridiales bacterium]|nr:fumarylacetoacetate hydrolase family protein [Clostridiales bacterium]